jgi:hypothetical protein
MTVEYLKMLLATAEEMLATASALPESASRDEALQMVRAYTSRWRGPRSPPTESGPGGDGLAHE